MVRVGNVSCLKALDYKLSIYALVAHISTRESIAFTIAGTEVNAKAMMPNRLMLRLDNAAALGSD